MDEISFWSLWTIWLWKKVEKLIIKKVRFQGWLKMAQFLLTEFLGLPTLRSIISDISSTILQILVPILLQISWIFQNTPNIYNLMVLKGVMDKKPKKSDNGKYAILSQPWNLTFFQDEIFQFFKTTPTFIIWWFWRELWTKSWKNQTMENMPFWANPEI